MWRMPPCLDVYVRLPGCSAAVLQTFIDRYVDVQNPGDNRLAAFTRTYITGGPEPGDADALAELRRDPCVPTSAFSLYVSAREHQRAIITITSDGAAVLGLSVDDPLNTPEALAEARGVLTKLRSEFATPDGLLGAELPPPQSRQEWDTESHMHRIDALP